MLWGGWEKKQQWKVRKKGQYGIKELVVCSQEWERLKGNLSYEGEKMPIVNQEGRKEKLGNKNSGTRKRKINGMYRIPYEPEESVYTH